MPRIKNREPMLWAEDALPENAAGCSKCELCRQRTRMIWGEGNPQGGLIVMLDNPGLREDKNGQPFVCGTRQTLQEAAYAAGFEQYDIYITYVLKCRPKKAYDKDTARSQCMEHLERQLRQNDFKAAFCLGDTAIKSFFRDPGQTVKNTRGKRHHVNGIPTYTSYHPLAVRRRPNLYSIFLKDWQAVKDFLESEKDN